MSEELKKRTKKFALDVIELAVGVPQVLETCRALIEADLVDCMVALPGQLFYSTQIRVCLWFLAKDKSGKSAPTRRSLGGERDRRIQALRAVNEQLTKTFWKIGHDIVEHEQDGQTRAAYGRSLITNLSRDLRLRHGKGFSHSNVIRSRQFYLAYPKGATLSHLLSWSHLVELLKLDDPLERGFYEQQCAREKWEVRELQRQIKSSLFFRLAASREKSHVLKLAAEGNTASLFPEHFAHGERDL